MKKARQQPANEYWDKKLLEAEEKDPNRWRHSGFKKLYVNGVRKSRSRSPVMRKTPVSPRSRHIPQSPVRRRPISRTPERHDRYRPKSPPLRYARKSPPPPRNDMKPKEAYRPKRPISPPTKVLFSHTNTLNPNFYKNKFSLIGTNSFNIKLLRLSMFRL